MIFADKLIQLRKKNGWSQEELANQMNVTRQSVSKWEGAQAIPKLEIIIKLSELFGVSIDYLLKDDMEETAAEGVIKEPSSVRSVSMEEASEFLRIKENTAKPIAYAVFLCIISPICLLILGTVSEMNGYLSENVAGGIGMIVLLMLIVIAVVIFISCGNKTAPYEYLEKEIFETEYGVTEMTKERKSQYKNTYNRHNMIGTCICILSLVPIFGGIIINEESDLFLVSMFCAAIVVAGIGVVFFTGSGIIWASFEKLLQEGDYSRKKKENRSVAAAVSTAYWLIAAAIFLGYSLTTNQWEYSWVIWVIAGVLYPAILAIINVFSDRK